MSHFYLWVELGTDQRSLHACSHRIAAVHLFGQQAHHQSDRTGSELHLHSLPFLPPQTLSSPLLFSTSTSGTLCPPPSLGSYSATCTLTDSRPTEAWHSAYTTPSPFRAGAVSQTAPARNPQMCLDKRMRISVAQIAIYCAVGVEGELDLHFPNILYTTVASGRNLLALKWCYLMLFKCGSGLPSHQQRR